MTLSEVNYAFIFILKQYFQCANKTEKQDSKDALPKRLNFRSDTGRMTNIQIQNVVPIFFFAFFFLNRPFLKMEFLISFICAFQLEKYKGGEGVNNI